LNTQENDFIKKNVDKVKTKISIDIENNDENRVELIKQSIKGMYYNTNN